jgi:hypothetical protein
MAPIAALFGARRNFERLRGLEAEARWGGEHTAAWGSSGINRTIYLAPMIASAYIYPGGATPIADERERDRAQEPITDMQAPLVDRICALRATTLAGHSARGAALVAWAADHLDADEDACWNERLLAAALRDLSAGAGVLPVTATAVRADAAAGPDARLVALAAELARLDRRLDDWNEDRIGEEEGEAASAEWWAAVDAMAGVRATTDAGFRAKARAVTLALDAFPEADSVHELARGLCRDLLAGAGQHDPPVRLAAVAVRQAEATAAAEAGALMNGAVSRGAAPSWLGIQPGRCGRRDTSEHENPSAHAQH